MAAPTSAPPRGGRDAAPLPPPAPHTPVRRGSVGTRAEPPSRAPRGPIVPAHLPGASPALTPRGGGGGAVAPPPASPQQRAGQAGPPGLGRALLREGPWRAAEAMAAPPPRRDGGHRAQPPARLPSGAAARGRPAGPAARPARTRAGAALPDLEQQDDDGRQVGQVPGEAEDVHGGGDRGGGAARSRRAKMA